MVDLDTDRRNCAREHNSEVHNSRSVSRSDRYEDGSKKPDLD